MNDRVVPIPGTPHAAVRLVRELLMRTSRGYRYLLRRDLGLVKPSGRPTARWCNGVLGSPGEIGAAVVQARSLGLPLHPEPHGNWDGLAALDLLLTHTDRGARILDAGAEPNSIILPWLFLYGYNRLHGINITLGEPFRRGPIVYEYGDITGTGFKDASFDAITCTRVVESGVDLGAYFREAARILRPGGLLFTSTDYWDRGLDAEAKQAPGRRTHVFNEREIESALLVARDCGLTLAGPLSLECAIRAVDWRPRDLHHTLLAFTLRRSA